MRKFYNIEDDKNPLTKKIPKKRFKTIPIDHIESKSEYLYILKAKTKQFQRQQKKIYESDENYKRR